MKRIAIYSRKSKFTGKGDSIGNQVEMCKNYINNLLIGVEIDVSVFEDEGFSGKNLERPDFKKMMEIHDIKPFDYIVVYRLDRISRNVGDCAKLMERLNTTHTAFISVSEPMYDTSKSSGVAMLNMSMVFAQLERDSITERIKDNMYMQAKSGRWTGGTTPLGFKSIKHTSSDVNGKSRSYFTLETDDTQIDLVKLIFSKYSELQSINATENYLNQTNNLTRNGNKWNKANVKRILENPIYCTADKESLEYFTKLGCNVCFDENDCNDGFGILPYNRHSGQDRKSSAPEKWLIAVSSHPGIMSGAEWIRIQDILKQNSKNCYGGVPTTKRRFNPKSILSGVLVCRCGSFMRPKIYSSGAMYYLCENKEQTKKAACDNCNVNGDELDKLVLSEIFAFDTKNTAVNNQLTLLRKQINNIDDNISVQIKKLETRKNRNEKAVNNLIMALANGASELTITLVNKKIEDINNDNSLIDSQIAELNERDFIQSQMHTNLNTIEEAIAYLRDNFDNLSIENKREYIKRIVEKVVWDGVSVHIFIKGSTV